MNLSCCFAPVLILLKSLSQVVTVGAGRTWLSCFCKLPHDNMHKGVEEVS